MPMRRALITGLVVALCACSTTPDSPASTAFDAPDAGGTVAPPGNCVPGDTLPSVKLIIDGKTVAPTFGIGSNECAAITGNGYIAFDYDPVLIDSKGAVEATIDGDATVTFAWSGGEPFVQTSPGRWQSAAPEKGCERLTIVVVSPAGTSTETVGADIRVGGSSVPCPQRGLGPREPIDTSVTETLPTIP